MQPNILKILLNYGTTVGSPTELRKDQPPQSDPEKEKARDRRGPDPKNGIYFAIFTRYESGSKIL